MCAVSIEFGVALWAATFLSERFATSQSVASAAFAAFPFGMVVGRLAAAHLALTRPARGLILSSLLTCAGGFVLFWLSPLAFTSVVGLLVTGLGVGPLYPLTIGLAISDAPSLAAAAASRGMLANGLAISISSFALGALADVAGLERAYGIVLVFIGIAAALLVTVRPQSNPV